MELSNRILASFLLVFIIAILFGTNYVLKEIDKLTGAGLVGQGNVSVTIAGVCGDDFVTGNEVCDGTNLSGETCVTLGNTGGTLACKSDCTGFNSQQCVNATAKVTTVATLERPRTGGTTPSLTYNVEAADFYDFIASRNIRMRIIFKGEVHEQDIEKIERDFIEVTFHSSHDTFLRVGLGQTKPVDLDGDGILDLTFTLKEILTRRAVFRIEKIKAVVETQVPQLQKRESIKFEKPLAEKYLAEEYIDAILLLTLIVLAIINFGLFRKFIASNR